MVAGNSCEKQKIFVTIASSKFFFAKGKTNVLKQFEFSISPSTGST